MSIICVYWFKFVCIKEFTPTHGLNTTGKIHQSVFHPFMKSEKSNPKLVPLLGECLELNSHK